MGRKILQVTAYTPEQIKELFNNYKYFKQGFRLYVVYQVAIGKKPQDLAEFYNVAFKSIINWVNRLNKEGLSGLIDKPIPGRKPKLNDSEKAEIKRLVLEDSPEQHGFNSATWTGPILIKYIENKYDISYKKAQIYNILSNMNLTYQKGKGIYPESESEQREEVVDALKKTPK